ncbi:lipopolysaccharide transport periplasmic protein LptA [Lichenibacterium minor]|uniref:lipopolysaccharide transport periplasmic protein LptA n=1 Tax=Lichenibacterium minor TaxID=2316528 RepID=UPI001FDFD706|nr:lipopolysaccharide transport periplasmic protein LptA [Lichenibacterium minor]
MNHHASRFAASAALILASSALLAAGPASAQKRPKNPASIPFVDDAAKKPAPAADAAPKKAAAGVPLLPGSGSKEPVNISADKLDFLNKENKLIYSGNVVVVQGESTMKASVLNIDLQKDAAGGATAPATPSPADGAAQAGGNSSVRHMEAEGPVTLISKDQVGTGDHATYDKGENKVYLNGNVTLSQGTNVTTGDRLVYNMTSGQAQVFSGQTNNGRVSSVFTPGSGSPAGAAKPGAAPAPAPSKGKQRTAKRGGEGAAARDAEAMQ